ncbi:GNAT family N-acetyltransferase [Hoeflea poritis]|uniref:GNAT family N-acetyltransferase n=1 Tax=Hoeflea poritis TaxID=2993659 RepID=A0ABT4VVA5_9HYPH|nr:GNAT family N-acetyltransferase [Hoeflea poritis]MDA4848658.1 GNAT family N-acetyltransferase [Hoeflea poritis]
MNGFEIFKVNDETLRRHVDGFAQVLNASVNGGASISFVQPHTMEDSRRFWLDAVLPSLDGDRRLLLVAMAGDAVAGTVQLDCDMPPNQPHRGEVLKLIVHPSFRRRGIARALMRDLECHARARGRMLLTLDTASAEAERLYASLGFARAGAIPGFARDPIDGRLEATTLMYKQL